MSVDEIVRHPLSESPESRPGMSEGQTCSRPRSGGNLLAAEHLPEQLARKADRGRQLGQCVAAE